jgi:hypothetical protein
MESLCVQGPITREAPGTGRSVDEGKGGGRKGAQEGLPRRCSGSAGQADEPWPPFHRSSLRESSGRPRNRQPHDGGRPGEARREVRKWPYARKSPRPNRGPDARRRPRRATPFRAGSKRARRRGRSGASWSRPIAVRGNSSKAVAGERLRGQCLPGERYRQSPRRATGASARADLCPDPRPAVPNANTMVLEEGRVAPWARRSRWRWTCASAPRRTGRCPGSFSSRRGGLGIRLARVRLR